MKWAKRTIFSSSVELVRPLGERKKHDLGFCQTSMLELLKVFIDMYFRKKFHNRCLIGF